MNLKQCGDEIDSIFNVHGSVPSMMKNRSRVGLTDDSQSCLNFSAIHPEIDVVPYFFSSCVFLNN